jgi:stage V sporulation protein B
VFYICYNKRRNGALSLKVLHNTSNKIDWQVIKRLFMTAVPITAMSVIFPAVLMFDSFFVVNALARSGISNATEMYGVSSGAVHTLINLPTVVGLAVATALVPAVARYYKEKKAAEIKQKSKKAIWVTLTFAVSCAVVYAVFAPLILKILYGGAFKNKPEEFAIAVLLLRVESIAIVLICLSQVITSILQGADKSKWPLIALCAGGAAKVLFEIFAVKKMGILAVSIANVGCFTVALAINAIILPKILSKRA